MPLNLIDIASNIEPVEEGLWSARTDSSVSYPEAGNAGCFALEDSSFWFRHRNNCILEIIKSFPPPGPFFDVGGGNGYVAHALQRAGIEVVLVEPGPTGARNAARRGIRQVVRSTLQDAGFRPQTLSAVGLFDVVEHIQNDRAFLATIHRLLIPGGRVYITVPAYQFLWSQEDDDCGHQRRYTLNSLSRLLEASGYKIEFVSCFFGFLPLPILVLRVLPYRLGVARRNEAARSEHKPGNRYVNRLLDKLTQRELSMLASGHRLRFGSSCFMVARKLEPWEAEPRPVTVIATDEG